MSKMEAIIDLVKDYMDRENWKYEYEEETNTIYTGVKVKCKLQNLRMGIRFCENGYLSFAGPSLKVKEEYLADVAEYITRANYGIKNGNFEMDYRDGEVRFKIYANFKGLDDFSEDIIEDSLIIPLLMFERYGDGLAALLMGFSTPEVEIDKAEKW